MSAQEHPASASEIRKDYLIDRWVIYAPERQVKPEVLNQKDATPVNYLPDQNPFMEGQEQQTPPELFTISKKADRQPDTPGWSVRVFPNGFPALKKTQSHIDPQALEPTGDALHQKILGIGQHELIVDAPQFESQFEQLPATQMRDLLQTFCTRMQLAEQHPEVRYVQVFKNQGAMAGASLPHVHSQLLTLPFIPPLVDQELTACQKFADENEGREFFDWLIENELELRQRIVAVHDQFLILAPFAARFQCETWIIPRRPMPHMYELTTAELETLSQLLHETLRVMTLELPQSSYNIVFHTAPVNDPRSKYYRWHIEILPRVTGIAGFELGTGCFVNPYFPEQMAENMRRNFRAKTE
jgi:UDPglucose--hexose-1-phosphate uridylyltransferase